MRRLEGCNRRVVENCAARFRMESRLRSSSALSVRGDEVLPRVTVTVPRALVKALIESREFSQRPREFDVGVCQLERLRGARPRTAALENLSEGGSIERAGPVLAVEVEGVQHATLFVNEGHQLDAAGVEDPDDLFAELLGSGTLLPADSSILSKPQWHRGSAK